MIIPAVAGIVAPPLPRIPAPVMFALPRPVVAAFARAPPVAAVRARTTALSPAVSSLWGARPRLLLLLAFRLVSFAIIAVFPVVGVLVVHLLEQLSLELATYVLRVHEVAVAATVARTLVVLAALGLTEICDG